MTTARKYADHEGSFAAWKDHPEPCNRLVRKVPPCSQGCIDHPCGAKVQIREWDSSDGAYTDYQYRCTAGHEWWIDGIDS